MILTSGRTTRTSRLKTPRFKNTPSVMSIWKGVFNGAWMLVLVWGLKEGMTIYEEGFLAVPIWNYALAVVGLIFVGGFCGALYAVVRNVWMR